MATVTGLTAERMLAIEAASVVDGAVVAGDLILTKHDGTQIDAGSVIGPAGPQGPQGLSSIPGEVKLWANDVLPDPAYGTWVWADGAVYAVSAHPIAASHIGARWKTFDGKPDPGAGNFRVPDLRGLIAAGLDAMPGGARANRMARAEAIVMALKTGEEKHILVVGEHAKHAHTVNSHSHGGSTTPSTTYTENQQHAHGYDIGVNAVSNDVIGGGTGNKVTGVFTTGGTAGFNDSTGTESAQHTHYMPGMGIPAEAPGTDLSGGDTGHENVQPTVFVPYIVCLDG